jgi:putative transposase
MAGMARHRRVTYGGIVYHVCNRGSRKGPLFTTPEEYTAFVRLLADGRAKRPMRIIAYCLMPNHWHLLLWPEGDNDLSRYLHWVTGTHARRFRRATGTVGQGAVYQSRFEAVGVTDLIHLLSVWRYVERNPVRAHLVERAEDWKWSSATDSRRGSSDLSLDVAPISRPREWLTIVNQETEAAELIESIRIPV